MMRIPDLFLLTLLSLLSVACATQDKEPELEPGCLDVIICSDQAAKNHG